MTNSLPPRDADVPVPGPPGVDRAAFEAWLAEQHPDLRGTRDRPVTLELIEGGRSNLTYAVEGIAEPAILRRGPLGHALATAHDVAREAKVISALAGTPVPVPRVLVRSDVATAGVDAPFFMMERVQGRVLRSRADNAGFDVDALRALAFQLVDTLAAIHSIDPVSVGLADLGRPDGYLKRQLLRWSTQLDSTRTRDLPELEELGSLLAKGVPGASDAALIHGDFRLDNVIVIGDARPPRVGAVLDWEMATVGDPLADLALFGLYWDIERESAELARALPSAVSAADGYPSFEQLVERYAAVRGIASPDLAWYSAFSAYKLAIIAEGVNHRFQLGKTVGSDFERMADAVRPTARIGLRHLGAVVGEDA